MASEAVLELTDENFEQEVVKSAVPVLVDFWAEWCMPCRMVAPYVEQLAEQYKGKLKVGKVDTEQSPNTAVQMGIASIPTLMVFKGGKVVSQIVGARGSAAALAKDLRIEDVLKS